jgi:hypothetical protein
MALIVMELNTDDLTISCVDVEGNYGCPGVYARSQHRGWIVKRVFSDGSVVVNVDCTDESLIESATRYAKYPHLTVFADALKEGKEIPDPNRSRPPED